MFYQLPPVGNPVVLDMGENSGLTLESVFSPYQAKYYQSGTAALAAAIIAAKRLKGIDHPEVILPAYGCPDLVSAALYAGVKPVLVDLEMNRPWMDLEKLRASVSARTAAVVAVSMWGISERTVQIRPIAESVGALLIEDSAQSFPVGDELDFWKGDLAVLSFGRGKPVGLLGGGAVLLRQRALEDLLPAGVAQASSGRLEHVLWRLKTSLYNRMISPRLYWLPHSLPFLHLGETRYHSLAAIHPMDSTRLAMLPANVAAYRNAGLEKQQAISQIAAEIASVENGVVDLPDVCKLSRGRRLLRYPLLLDGPVRDQLYERLLKSGSGASLMYPAVLPDIPGLQELFRWQGPFPVAVSFARRILTLPTHSGVRAQDIAAISQALVQVASLSHQAA